VESYRYPPYFDNYYSDWTQLGFFYKEFEGWGYAAYHYHEMDPYGVHEVHIMMMNLYALKACLAVSFEEMAKAFVSIWWHEYRHLIGLTEIGITVPKPTIVVAS